MACGTCGKVAGFDPRKISMEDLYKTALTLTHSGISQHLPYLRKLAEEMPDAHVTELGVGGADQSTVCWSVAKVKSLTCYDVNKGGNIDKLAELCKAQGTAFEFKQGDILTAEVVPNTLLMVDSLHNKAQVEVELERFVTPTTMTIVFHDVCAFGDIGQFTGADQGINLAIARWMFRNPEWRVFDYRENDNGLLTLTRTAFY